MKERRSIWPLTLLVVLVSPAQPAMAADPHLDADASFIELYSQHFRAVWRNLRRLGVPDPALDDAVQDVFLVAHRRWAEFEGRSSVKTWIFGIVLRVAHDHRRSACRHQARVDRLATASAPRASTPPDEMAERLQAARIAHAVLDELDDQQRAVFVLVELEQLTVKETAAATGLTLATCQRRLRAARVAFDAGIRRRFSRERGGGDE